MEKLYELHGDERFDLVVVDTPPTRNALDFLDAPRRLTRVPRQPPVPPADAADPGRPAGRWAWPPRPSCGRSRKVVGSEVVSAMRSPSSRPSRAWRTASATGRCGCSELLGDRRHGVRLGGLAPRATRSRRPSSSPRSWTRRASPCDALVVNRMHPRFGPVPTPPAGGGAGTPAGAAVPQRRRALPHGRRRGGPRRLAGGAPSSPRRSGCPSVDTDVHDLAGLARVAAYLFAG